MQQNQDEVDDWSICPRLSCSLHLDDILDENKCSNQGDQSAPRESVDSNLSDKVKLFQLYVSACERKSPRSEDSDSSDESIQHGRDCCASSRDRRDNHSHSNLDSFLIKPCRRSSVGGEAELAFSSQTTPASNGGRRPLITEKNHQQLLLSQSFSGWPCQRTQQPQAFSSFKVEHSRPHSGILHRPTPADRADFDMYQTQVVAALTSGKPVWL
jgi:hypothetical protein